MRVFKILILLVAVNFCVNAKSDVFQVGITSEASHMVPGFKDILVEMYKRNNIKIEFRVLPSKRILELLNLGEIQADAVRVGVAQDYYKNIVKVNEPFGASYVREYKLKSFDPKITREIIGCKRGFVICDEFTKQTGKKIDILVNSHEQLAKLLMTKRITHFVMFTPFFKGLGLELNEKIEQTSIQIPMEHFHYIGKANQHLKEKLEKTIKLMKDEGLFEKLKDIKRIPVETEKN